jgi:hypothetical protein
MQVFGMLMERKGLVKYLLDRDDKAAKKFRFAIVARVTTGGSRRGVPSRRENMVGKKRIRNV